MISKNEIKLIRSLKTKKFRDKHNLFVAEGEKLVRHFANNHFAITKLFCTEQSSFAQLKEAVLVSLAEMKSISLMDTPNTVLALVEKKQLKPIPTGKVLILDDVRDPGNLGTIIRLADWFGVEEIVCSQGTVDLYNAKVVNSSMGSMANVSVRTADLVDEIPNLKKRGYTIVGTLLDAEEHMHYQWPDKYGLVLGNEGQGISQEVIDLLDSAVTIPKAPTASAESLNVAMTAAVLLS